MLQMVWKSGDKEQVLDLVDTPEFVLVQCCRSILKYQDLRNPDARYMLRETINALKVKAEQEPDGPGAMYRYDMKEQLAEVEKLLEKYEKE